MNKESRMMLRIVILLLFGNERATLPAYCDNSTMRRIKKGHNHDDMPYKI
ncbi:MAG TPA: hypothetical protein PLI74_06525 [Candidatus Kapabacteria bacterium]|nr:hypothetical protein [Candidatus Kapabacteria bacterium]HRI31738.1 hypothetical protein [Candidatus Kapabacteria bacterium]HRK59278.1 hypothetical protein [Candidatus Kapabacteria bacterium]